MRYLVRMRVVWLVAWLCVMPLVHVHPEADHRHGLPGHVHGGTFHTVFSPELRCATPAARLDEAADVSPAKLGIPAPLSAGMHLGDHPTIAFSLLTSTVQPVLVQQVHAASLEACPELPRLAPANSPCETIIDAPLLLLWETAHARAPPSSLSV